MHKNWHFFGEKCVLRAFFHFFARFSVEYGRPHKTRTKCTKIASFLEKRPKNARFSEKRPFWAYNRRWPRSYACVQALWILYTRYVPAHWTYSPTRPTACGPKVCAGAVLKGNYEVIHLTHTRTWEKEWEKKEKQERAMLRPKADSWALCSRCHSFILCENTSASTSSRLAQLEVKPYFIQVKRLLFWSNSSVSKGTGR